MESSTIRPHSAAEIYKVTCGTTMSHRLPSDSLGCFPWCNAQLFSYIYPISTVVTSTQATNQQIRAANSAAQTAQASQSTQSCDLSSREWPIAIAAIFAYVLFTVALSCFIYLYRKQVRLHVRIENIELF
jgi:hypothetical protein